MTKLSFNENTFFKRPTGKPIFKFNNSSEIKNYYSKISDDSNESIYNLEYDVLANQDIAFDLLHVGLLFDRQIRVNLYKDAIKNLPLLNRGSYNVNKHGTFLKTQNNPASDVFFCIKHEDIGTNLITSINNNEITFNDTINNFPVGLRKNDDDGTEHTFTIPELYKNSVFTNDDVPQDWKWVADVNTPTNRKLNIEIE